MESSRLLGLLHLGFSIHHRLEIWTVGCVAGATVGKFGTVAFDRVCGLLLLHLRESASPRVGLVLGRGSGSSATHFAIGFRGATAAQAVNRTRRLVAFTWWASARRAGYLRVC
jgi:hypothetical protein